MITISINLLTVLSVSRISSLILLCRSSGSLHVKPFVSILSPPIFLVSKAYSKASRKAIIRTNKLRRTKQAEPITSGFVCQGGEEIHHPLRDSLFILLHWLG